MNLLIFFKDITKPSFLPFLMKHPNSILIIEDAENVIQDRKRTTIASDQAVSNLLNLSDGLLGDAIHQQLICTFNCDLHGIDPALLRDGRLVLEHKFEKLSPENARRLCEKLNVPGHGEDIHEPISLAEIYARTTVGEQTTTNGVKDREHVKKNRRPLKRRKTDSDSLFGFYA